MGPCSTHMPPCVRVSFRMSGFACGVVAPVVPRWRAQPDRVCAAAPSGCWALFAVCTLTTFEKACLGRGQGVAPSEPLTGCCP